MKKLIFTFLMFLTLSVNAQNFEVVKFLGIPVDGLKNEMISKLEKKGFKRNPNSDNLEGEFNGDNVRVSVITYKEKVGRIMVAYNYTNETDIKIAFNKLVNQFEKSQKYSRAVPGNQYLDDNINILYEIIVNKKRIEASFCQHYTEDDMIELKNRINDNYEVYKTNADKYLEKLDLFMNYDGNKLENVNKIANTYNMAYMNNNSVWFMIHNDRNEYCILLYYDNLNNMPDGEDL